MPESLAKRIDVVTRDGTLSGTPSGMVVNHSPAIFRPLPDGGEPSGAIRSIGPRKYELACNKPVITSQHAYVKVFVTQLLDGTSGFPKPLSHGLFNCTSPTRGTS